MNIINKNTKEQKYHFGIHLLVHSDEEIGALISEIPALASLGVDHLITEINYHFAFTSHPELRAQSAISRDKIHSLYQQCNDFDIELIPQFQCLGHQSWAKTTFPLLIQYPEFDETPGQYVNNEGIYCRSWCPQHPDVNSIVFSLIDELIDVFQASTIHIGMDEVFLIGSEYCPRCAGHDPAQLFAKSVKDIYTHIVQEKACGIMVWGDRLLNSKTTGYGEWEAAENGTDTAIDLIPKDIIICDWHYELRESYPSIPTFIDRGFRVIASGWHDTAAVKAFYDFAISMNNDSMLGYLCTTWGKVKPGEIAQFAALQLIARSLV